MVLPHRLEINRSLRKKAEELRDKIDNYAERYDAHYKKNTAELEAVKEKIDNEYEKAKEDAIRVISSASSELQELTNLISEYLTAFYNRKIFIKLIECNSIQQSIVKQYEHFLTQQMSEIGEEIDLLKKRIEILSGEADIQDILQLISLCGSAISIDNISSAQDLLDYISNLMSTSTENDSIQWYTLMNVRTMLEERVTFLDEIQFITWVIAQKIQLSKELKSIRNKQRTLLKKLQKEEKQLHDEKHSLDTVVTNTEHSIRFLFARKIVLLSVEIDSCYEEKDSRYSDLDSVKHDIDDMKTSHSHDSYKWDRLQRDHKSIYGDIESLKSEIEIKQSNRKKWHSRRNELFAIIQLRTRGKKDEQEFVHSRLQELRKR